MTPEVVVDIGRQALMIVIMTAAPPLLTALAVGLMVSMLQAATSIQEMTLTFIPKLLALFAALMIMGHWMIELLTSYTIRLYESVPSLIG
jgi:flagellar biosynthetic protein FliQ